MNSGIIKLSVETDRVSKLQLRDHYNPQILQDGTGIQAEIPVLWTQRKMKVEPEDLHSEA